MKKSAIVQTLWIGPKLGRMERLSLISFLRNSHIVHLYTYGEVENVPEGIIIMDGNSIIPANKIFRYKDSNSYAGFSNLFRYKLLLEKGGYWVDSDIVCLKPLFTPDEYVFASERLIYGSCQVNNCLIGTQAGTKIMESCYDIALSKDPNELKWGVTGPILLTQAVNHFNLGDFVNDPDVFCTVNWWEADHFIKKSFSEIVNDVTYTIHFYNESWKDMEINKEDIYDENCIYEELFKMYSVIT